MGLTQVEVDHLININKKKVGNLTYTFPTPENHTIIPLVSVNNEVEFKLDFYHAKIKWNKVQAAELYGGGILLLRMCVGGKSHINPQASAPSNVYTGLEGRNVGENHLHCYVEGWGTIWATPLDVNPNLFYPLTHLAYYFMDICHVIDKPVMTGGF